MGDFGRGRAYPLNPTHNGQVVEPEGYAEEVVLEPKYPNLLRWFINAIATDSFDGSHGRRLAIRSVIDITRYMAHKDPQELQAILAELPAKADPHRYHEDDPNLEDEMYDHANPNNY
jgi:hypothetical protein